MSEQNEMDVRNAEAKRLMRKRFKVLCARFPNNSFRLVDADSTNIEQRIVHSDALTAMRLAEDA